MNQASDACKGRYQVTENENPEKAVKEEPLNSKLNIKEKNVAELISGLSSILSAFFSFILNLLPDVLAPNVKIKVLFFLLGFSILSLLIFLELKTTRDFLGVARYKKISNKDFEVRVLNVGKWIVFSYIAFTFLFAPFINENVKLFTNRGVKEVTQEPPTVTMPIATDDNTTVSATTKVPALTDTSTPDPTATPTPNPTVTPEPTPTSNLFKYKVGVFEQNPGCGEKDKNYQIITGLKELGFNANQVPIETSNDYAEYNVLYMPYGWSCTQENYDFDSIREFLELPNTGLLIGDPKPDDLTTLRLFSYKVYFDHLSPESASLLNTPEFIDSAIKEKFYVIFKETSDNDLPVAESKLTITNDAEGYFRVITQSSSEQSGNLGWYNSFIASANEKPRFAIMPGSEYIVSDNAIPAELMINIIKWLAHARVGN